MSTNFPTSLDSLTNPTSGDTLNSPDHAAQHANANDALEAIEAKVGADSSAVTTSHDYKLSGVTGSAKAVSTAVAIVTSGKTLSVSNTLTLAGTDSTTMTFPSTSATVARTDAGNTFTGVSTATSWSLVGSSLSSIHVLAENTELQLDPVLSADGKYCGITEVVTAGETIAFGDIVYLKAADSQWYKAIASADATAGAVRIAIAVTTGADNGSMTIMTYGKIRADANFPALTVGAPAYISGSSAGDIVTAQPTTTDYVIRIVGHANTGDELFFNPSNDYLTHV